jgi:penicillin-binding protein 1C
LNLNKLSFLLKLNNHIFRFKILYSIILLLFVLYIFSLPGLLFSNDYSTVVFDCKGELVGARVTSDGQWRFPENDSLVSSKYIQSLLCFEDKHFFNHPGFNPVSLFKAAVQNIKHRCIVSGGSTISMQVIRLFRHHSKRTVLEKIREIILATRLELRYSKSEILSKYYNNAPFGGNIVGIQAACWRLFGRSPDHLSWSDAALLAVLPNSPSILHVNRNREILINKRNKLLKNLFFNGNISYNDYQLSLLEPLPDKLIDLPDLAPQLTEKLSADNSVNSYISTLDVNFQENISRKVSNYMEILISNEIFNACAIVINVRTMEIMAYVANVPKGKYKVEGQDVDLITSARSTGSILKPLLFAGSISDGIVLPETLIPDIPTVIGGFKPENYSNTYDGAVPAKYALSRSLNIPCVRLLQKYGVPKFYNLLTNLGITSFRFPCDHYGLTLVVGGAEGKLYDIAGIYAKLAYTLNYFNKNNNYPDSIPEIHYLKKKGLKYQNAKIYKTLDAGSIYLTFKALLEVNRPDEESGWLQLGSSKKIAWKTGTSFGFRDAWAIGTTPEYVVGVWAGNADGEGRPGLTGVGAAAPLLFQIFSILPATSWFNIPYDELEKVKICKMSGYKASDLCSDIDTVYVPRKGVESGLCPYHKLFHLSKDKKYRVSQSCCPPDLMSNIPLFVLPPAMEYFYKKKNLFYKPLPPVLPGCNDDDDIKYMEFIYPNESVKVFIPRELDGTPGKIILEVAHRYSNSTIYWHIDNEYINSTTQYHKIAVSLSPGKHKISVVDSEGNSLNKYIEVVDK